MNRIILSVVLLTGASAQAETSSPAPSSGNTERPALVARGQATAGMDDVVSAFGLLSYWYAESGLGVGARYQNTIAPGGVLRLPTVHDDVGLELGVDAIHYSFFGATYNEIAFLVGGVWNFWFADDRLALYPKLDLGYRVGSWSASRLGGYGGLVFQGSVGLAYRVSRVALRAEAGSGSLRLGAGFAF